MGGMVRAAALRGLVGLVNELGGDGEALVGRFGLSSASIASDDALVVAQTAAQLLETAAMETASGDLGLRLAERQGADVLGPLAVVVRTSPTLGDALAAGAQFLFVHSPALTISQAPDPEGHRGIVAVHYGSVAPDELTPQSLDLGLGLFHRIITLLHGGSYGLRTAWLTHPPLVPIRRYTDFFGTDVRFNQEAGLLRVPAELTTSPVPGSDPVVHAIAVDYLRTNYRDPTRPMAEQVRAMLSRHPDGSRLRFATAAELLSLHPRTLQRRLADEDTSYEAILDDFRRETARRLITETDLPLRQVAAVLGFAEQSALTRSVRRWFGQAPSHLRSAAGVAQQAAGAQDSGRGEVGIG